MAKVLVVDDSITAREEVTTFLRSYEIETETAENGLDALEKLLIDDSFRLAIVDLNMPILDGIGLAERVKEEVQNKKLSLLMLTTEHDPELKARGKAAGVKGWIMKPFNGQKAIGFIQKILAD